MSKKQCILYTCDKCGRELFTVDDGTYAPPKWELVLYKGKTYHFCEDCLPRLHRVFEWLGFDVNE